MSDEMTKEQEDRFDGYPVDCIVSDLLAAEKVIDGFWEGLWNRYDMESREEVEKDTKDSWAKGTSPLNVALHYIWKREPKVAELVEVFRELTKSILDSVSLEYMDDMTDGKMTKAVDALLAIKEKK